MAVSEAHKRASLKWKNANYSQITYSIPKDFKEVVIDCAQSQGLSLNRFIDTAVKAYIKSLDKRE